MRVKVSGPIGTRASPTNTVDISGWCWRLTSLNGVEIAHDLDDAGQRAQVEAVEAVEVADEADDRALVAAADERLAAGVGRRG